MRAPDRRRRTAIVSRIYVPEPAAASFALVNVARAFRDAGHEVEVLTSAYRDAPRRETADGITVRRAPVRRNAAGYVRGYLSYMSFDVPLFFRLMTMRRPDLVYVEPPPTTGAVVRVATALRGIPYVYDAADIWSDAAVTTTRSTLVPRLLRAVERFAMRGARHAVVVAEPYAARMRELGIRTPTSVVGFGVDTATFEHHPAPASGADGPLFVYGGSYSEWHGAAVFVEAFPAVLDAQPGARLLFVGNGTERRPLEARASELGIAGSIEFRDTVTGTELSRILSGATASLASLEPGLGYDYAFATKVYASLASGCPVVFAGAGPTGPFVAEASREVAAGRAVAHERAAVEQAMLAAAADPPTENQRAALSAWTRTRHSLQAVAERVVQAAAR